jgi:predicted RNA-binding protein associated with RNAse of E/G family
VFEQTLVHETDTVLVTYMAEAGVTRPVTVDRQVVLEARSPAVWFTFPGARHDIGRFHTPAGDFTGYYANILTPVDVRPGEGRAPDQWRTTDLFLDLFLAPSGRVYTLDRNELREAVDRGWVDHRTAAATEQEAGRLARLARQGAWPPAVVAEWPLERARSAAGG